IFYYDGPEQSELKWGMHVSTCNHWMVKPTCCMLDVFNILWHKAYGEAEAKLASMNMHHIIDVVLTDNSDMFVFGAQTVLQNSSLNPEGEITLYEAHNILHSVSPQLTHEGFVLMAVLCGGDYD
ncbi:PIN domain-like protein, partial [Gyrodon lividus]